MEFTYVSIARINAWVPTSRYGGDPTATSPAGGQLCWGNTSLIQYVTERVRVFLRQPTVGAKHGAKIVSISNTDAFRPTWCNRSADAAIIAEEGSPMGPLLRAVNTVADAIKEEFPDVAVSTLACECCRALCSVPSCGLVPVARTLYASNAYVSVRVRWKIIHA